MRLWPMLLALAVPASAARDLSDPTSGPLRGAVTVLAGVAQPLGGGGFNDAVNPGLHAALEGLRDVTPWFALGARFDYLRFDGRAVVGGRQQAIALSWQAVARAKYWLGDNLNAHVGAGLGVNRFEMELEPDVSGVTCAKSPTCKASGVSFFSNQARLRESSFGTAASLSAGVWRRLGRRAGVGVEGRFHHLFIDGDAFGASFVNAVAIDLAYQWRF